MAARLRNSVPERLFIELPWPPSANRYYRTHGHVHLSREGARYKAKVAESVQNARERLEVGSPLLGLLSVVVTLSAPNTRGYDTDNRIKPLLDALEGARLLENDKQIRKHLVQEAAPGRGLVAVEIEQWEGFATWPTKGGSPHRANNVASGT